MAANTQPIYSRLADWLGTIWTSSLTGNTKSDGTGTIGTDMLLAFTADASEGSFLDRIRFTASASAAGTATTASVIRVYISTVGSGATARTDTFLFAEVAAPSVTSDSATVPLNYVEVPMGVGLPAGAKVLWSMHHAAAANTSWQANVFGGKF